MIIPIPVKICWNLFSRRMFTTEVKKKNRAAHAAHFSYISFSEVSATYLAHEGVDPNEHGDELVELGRARVGVPGDLGDGLLVIADDQVVLAGVIGATDYLSGFL
jgi:hypothetical protein